MSQVDSRATHWRTPRHSHSRAPPPAPPAEEAGAKSYRSSSRARIRRSRSDRPLLRRSRSSRRCRCISPVLQRCGGPSLHRRSRRSPAPLGVIEVVDDVVAQIIMYPIGIPAGPRQGIPHAVRILSPVTSAMLQRFLCGRIGQQSEQEPAHPPEDLHPGHTGQPSDPAACRTRPATTAAPRYGPRRRVDRHNRESSPGWRQSPCRCARVHNRRPTA